MKFFDSNVIARYQGGTINETSGNGDSAFSETTEFSYQSDGQDTDGDTVELERIFTFEQSFDSLCILASNFKDAEIWIKTTELGSYTNITSTATVLTSDDGLSKFYKWPTVQNFWEFKVVVDDTIVANQEKECGCIMAFTEIGDLYIFADISPKKIYNQKKLKLDQGGVVVVNKGSHWEFKLKSKYLGVQAQADIIQNLQNLGREFFIWINSGLETAKIEVAPYRFNDFIKCVHTGKPNPKFYKNYLNSVLDDGIDFEQTGQLK